MIETICTPYGKAAFPTVAKCDGCGCVIEDWGSYGENGEHFCADCSTQANQEFRICVHCGLPLIDGFTNEGNDMGADFHCHQECFESAMNKRYGVGKWKQNGTDDEGEYGGYYDELLDDGTWEDTGIYYTQYY